MIPRTDNEMKWDKRFLRLAVQIAMWSKDPSTKVGAVITDSYNRVLGLGYNGFPRGTSDSESLLNDRETKYARVIHGEVNAILNSTISVQGSTLYQIPFASCSRCAAIIIQSGISKVVYPVHDKFSHMYEKQERWKKSTNIASEMFAEAGIVCIEYEYSTFGINWSTLL